MLYPAQLYEDSLKKEFLNTWYKKDYIYYYCYDPYCPDLKTFELNGERSFVSVDKNNNIIGFFSYKIDTMTNSAYNFGAICFDKNKICLFSRDLLKAINQIFFDFGINRIEWFCYLNNPALKMYKKFCNRYGGRQVGILRQAGIVGNGKKEDIAIFELLSEDYLAVYERTNGKGYK